MKYIKGVSAHPLDSYTSAKMTLHTNMEYPEGIWIKEHPEEAKVVLQNHAINFYPFPSWGAMLPKTKSYDVTNEREAMQLELHPEAWDDMFEQGVFDSDGNFIAPEEQSDDKDGKVP